MAKPRSLHPPPPPPPGGGVPGSAGDGTSRESCRMSTPRAQRGGRSPGRAARPGSPTFIGAGSERGPAAESPPLGPARPAGSRPLPSSGPGAPPRRVCQPVTWFCIRPARRSDSHGGGGGREQAIRAPPGAPRGNGLPAARPAAVVPRLPGRPPASPRHYRPAPARSSDASAAPRPAPPAQRAPHAPPGSPPPHLPPQVRAPPRPRPGRALHPGSPPRVAMSRQCWWRASTHQVACARRFGLGRHSSRLQRGRDGGTRDTGPRKGDFQKHGLLLARAAALLPPSANHLWRVSGRHGDLAPPGASLPPGVWRSPSSPPPGIKFAKNTRLAPEGNTPSTPPGTSWETGAGWGPSAGSRRAALFICLCPGHGQIKPGRQK